MNDSNQTELILAAVQKVCEHELFQRSPMLCAFLRYIVHETLHSRQSRIIAYSVAVDALGRPADFDPQTDASVRVMAKRLRDSLKKYHELESDYPVRIELTPGSYVPTFVFNEQLNQSENYGGGIPTPVPAYLH